ncbi:MAG: A24 family peptidase [Phascolarctobacterium sp.]|nr:A24 family peptidase [Phascolarctobacterium sp.]
MITRIALALAVAAFLTPLSQRLMAWCLERNRDSLAEYNMEPGPVCSNIALAAGLFVAMFLGLILPASTVGKALSCFLLCWLWLLWLIDYRFQFIFDDSLLPLVVVGLAATPWLPFSIWQRLAAGAGAFVVLAALAILGRGALGGGDVKMMAALGLWFGVNGIITTASVGFIIGGIAAIVMLLFKVHGRKDFFAFGPFLIIGAVVAWLGQLLLWK